MLSIIVPVYNEAGGILDLFDEIENEIHVNKLVYVVYDFDEDSTVPIVKSCINDYSYKIVLLKNTLGRGALNAIKMGMNVANSEKVLVMMADSSDRLDVVDCMCKKMDEGYDLVCGSRFVRGGSHKGGPFLKGLFSRLAGVSLHLLTGMPTHDCSNSFKMYRKSMLNAIEIESQGGFEIGLEILVKAYTRAYKICEVPSEWYEPKGRESNFHMWKWMPSYLHWYFYCIKNTWFQKRKSKAR